MGWPKGVPRKQATATPVAMPINEVTQMQSQTHTIPGTGVSGANAKVAETRPQTHSLDNEGTTNALFPDFREETTEDKTEVKTEEQKVEEPIQQPDPVENQSEQKDVEQQDPAPAESAKPVEQENLSKYLDPDQFGDFIVPQVINGQKKEVKFKDLIRISQTDQAITQKAQRVAEERRQLEALKQELSRQKPVNTEPVDNSNQFKSPGDNDRISQLEATIAQLSQGLAPVMYQNARQRVANELKEDGFDDFLEYIPKIEQVVATVEDNNLFNYYNTPEGAKSLYYQLKAKELKSSPPQPQSQQKKEPVLERQRPPIVKLESGRSSSNGVTDDWNAKYQEAIKFARNNPGNVEAMNRVLRLKGLL